MLAALNVANPIDSKLRDSFETELSRLVSGIEVVGRFFTPRQHFNAYHAPI